MPEPAPSIVLASGSAARREMLQQAGVVFDVVPSTVDEDTVRAALSAREPGASAARIAAVLAHAKAADVSRAHPHALVVGADQTLAVQGRLLTKARDRAEARLRLLDLRGREHALYSAVAIVRDGGTPWTQCDQATLTMRAFSETFLERYLDEAGAAVTWSVGAYQIEGRGIQLFEHVAGDYFTILGMPLIPLLAELRRRGALPS